MAERQDLALTGGTTHLARPSDLFTPRLWGLATADTEDPAERFAKIAAIAGAPALREEAARVLPMVQRMLDGRPSNDELGVALQPLLIVKRKPDFGRGPEGERLKDAWQAIYYAQLRRFPIAAVRAGVKDLLAKHVYPDMPQPAEIVKAVEPYAAMMRTAAYRLKQALEHRPKPHISAEEKAMVREMMQRDGWLDENGNVSAAGILRSLKNRGPAPAYRAPRESPQEMAERLRQASVSAT